jgi:hypothetical protein
LVGLGGLSVVAGLTAGLSAGDKAKPSKSPGVGFPPEAVEFFEARVRPILLDRCVKCHGPKKQSSGLRLDSRESVLKGGQSGPAVVPANPEESLLIQAVSHRHDELKMPPSGKLPQLAIETLRHWVALGAPWPAEAAKNTAPPRGSTKSAVQPAHWAFRPVRPATPPPVQDRRWGRSPVDDFVLARLEAEGLAPSPPASKRTLIRRATIDLWGIPPTIEDIEAFEADTAPGAFGRVVDRLLASPRYGERWGRHWLDVARYADTKGYVFTQERRYPYAYTYRDYVIAALNADLPYDQFILHQLAADQLIQGDDQKPLAAMGFLTVGRRFLNDQNEIIDDRIDVVCRGLLGLTVTCARCHDHKYDPIPSDDYYSLYGVFASSVEPAELPLLNPPRAGPQFADYQRKLAAAKKAHDQYVAARLNEFTAEMRLRFSAYLKAAYDLNFEPRNRRLEERALASGLNSPRLRGVIVLWRRHLETSSPVQDPVLGPWRAFAALPADSFAAGAAALQRELREAKGSNTSAVHPLVARALLGAPSATMAEVVARYTAIFAELETRWKSHTSRSPGAVPTALPEADWESLRLSLFGPHGWLAVPGDLMRFVLNQSQRAHLERLNGAIQRINATHPASPARAMVLTDAPQQVEPHVFLRGDPGRPGRAIPRRFLRLLSSPDAKPFQHGSGRLELARAIADRSNPLTARVLVNRVWQWHFGQGLVATSSDFGLRSEPPTHPELLDDLAAHFITSGWSWKALHRRIMLSSTYQQQSEPRSEALARDPENRLLWRFNRQRLDFEAMRDSVLAVSGALRSTFGGASAPITEPAFSTRRTLYGLIDRQNLSGDYRTFDFAVPDATSPRRFVTSVPQQALFLMNSHFLHDQARQLAALVQRQADGGSHSTAAESLREAGETVRRLYRRVLGRFPEPDELALATDFIRRQTASSAAGSAAWRSMHPADGRPRLSPWEQLSQVLLLTNEFMFID